MDTTTIDQSTQTERPLVQIPAGLTLTSAGYRIDTSPASFGALRDSSELIDDIEALRARMIEDGYLYLPGYLDRELALESRRVVTERLQEHGHLQPGTPAMDAVAHTGSRLKFKPSLADNNPPLQELLYNGRMIDFYTRFFGGDVRHFDFTWMCAVAPGVGTQPHQDIVFMGRGTHNLLTAWTPLGDISLEQGGLMILEKSHQFAHINMTYGQKDVDSYCSNHSDAEERAMDGFKVWGGYLAKNPVTLRKRTGRRWLTGEFRAGDLLTFTMFTIHASLDNHSDRIRLSSDTRYQLASEPVDERWIGEHPVGHSRAGETWPYMLSELGCVSAGKIGATID